MKFVIKHEIKGRMRIHVLQDKMTFEQADILQYYFSNLTYITSVKVYERNQDMAICYLGSRETLLKQLRQFAYAKADVPEAFLANSGRELNQIYWDKLVNKVVLRYGGKLFIPAPVMAAAIFPTT